MFNQIVPKSTSKKHIQFVQNDGSLFGTQKPNSFDRVKFSVVLSNQPCRSSSSLLLLGLQVLVDVPCTSDRHSLVTAFNIFSKKRIEERVELPDYQRKLLESVFDIPHSFIDNNALSFLDQLYVPVNRVASLSIPHVLWHLCKTMVS